MRLGELGAIRRAARTLQDSDEVDDRVLFLRQTRENRLVMDIGLHDVDRRQQYQMPGTRAAPDRHRDPQAPFDETGHDMTPDEAGAADDEHIRELHLAP